MVCSLLRVAEQIASENSAWFVLTTHPHSEERAIENLRRQSLRAYCPMVSKRVRHSRRCYEARRPLFPGYVFAAQADARQAWRPLLSTFGVKAPVLSGGRPASLPPGFVESLQAREVDGVIAKTDNMFEIGQQVTIRGGAFDGLVAQIIGLKENDRILVLIELLQRQTRAQLRLEQLL
jgi:transcriptional antiterminator RfaH